MTVERFGIWVREMETIPRGYGVAWYSPWSCRAFCMRVPLNRLVGGFRAWYLSWRRPCDKDPVIAAFNEGYYTGLSDGIQQGVDSGRQLAEILHYDARRP